MEDTAGSVLVVDDAPQICKALSDVLTASGYSVRSAPSGERALQIMEPSEFDLIITDLKMSGMSGMDLIARVKERAPHLSIVILSGYGDMDDVIKAMRVGITDYLKKPFSIDEVLDVVKREVKKSQARAAAVTPAAPSASAEARPDARPARVYIFSRPDLDKIEVSLSKLRAQTAAESVLLLEEAGYVIAAKGMVADTDVQALSSLIVGGRSMSN